MVEKKRKQEKEMGPTENVPLLKAIKETRGMCVCVLCVCKYVHAPIRIKMMYLGYTKVAACLGHACHFVYSCCIIIKAHLHWGLVNS